MVIVMKNKCHKWAIDLTRTKQDRAEKSDLVAPVGYSDRISGDVVSQDADSNLVAKKCWDVALGPLKQLPMNLFLMYMAGNTISIFPIMMVGMMVWRPIQALMQLKATFKMLEGSPQAYIQMFVFFVSNLLGIASLSTNAQPWVSYRYILQTGCPFWNLKREWNILAVA